MKITDASNSHSGFALAIAGWCGVGWWGDGRLRETIQGQ